MGYRANLFSSVLVKPAIHPTTTNAGALSPVTVDGRGYDRAMFLLHVGTGGVNTVVTAKVNVSTSATGTRVVKSTTLATAVANTGRQDVYIIDMPVSSTHPFMELIATAGTNWIKASAICILYNGTRLNPPSQDNTMVVI